MFIFSKAKRGSRAEAERRFIYEKSKRSEEELLSVTGLNQEELTGDLTVAVVMATSKVPKVQQEGGGGAKRVAARRWTSRGL